MFNKLSLSEQVEAALRKEITEGRVQPGERVNLADYQHNWNVSATPFRDAARTLEAQGFLTIEPRKGIYVAAIDTQSLREIFDVRIALECMAVELATENVPQDQADRVRTTYLDMQARLAKGEAADFLNNDRLVHDLAYQHCRNIRLQKLLASQSDLIRWVQSTLIQEVPNSYALALPEHIDIMNAICKRAKEAAARAMRTHLENSRQRIEAKLPRR